MKKNLSLLINNDLYSGFNRTIELNFRIRNLQYFSKNINPINDILFHNKKILLKKNNNETYTGGFLNISLDDKKKEFKQESIFNKKCNTSIDSKNISEKKDKNTNKKIKIESNSKPLKILIDHAIESPFKYYPKYTSIYKNIPNIKINPKQYGPEIRRKISNNIKLRKKNELLNKEKEKEKKNIEMKKCNNFGNILKIEFKNKNKIKKKDKNNHALSFEKNISRNKLHLIYGKNDNNNRILTYIKNFNYISNNKHKNVNYKKMRPRKDFISQNFYEFYGLTYTPKYTLIDKNIPSIIFNSKDKIKKNEKKNKLRKVLSSYNIIKNYEIIDGNELLSKNKSLKIKN